MSHRRIIHRLSYVSPAVGGINGIRLHLLGVIPRRCYKLMIRKEYFLIELKGILVLFVEIIYMYIMRMINEDCVDLVHDKESLFSSETI